MQPRTAASPAVAARSLLGLLLLLAAPGARGQAAPGAEPETSPAEAAPPYPDPAALQRAASPIPACGWVTVTSGRCTFQRKSASMVLIKLKNPRTTVVDTITTALTQVGLAGNGLRQVLKRTFPANPRKPVNYRVAPAVTVTAKPAGGTEPVSRTARLMPSRERSVTTARKQYMVQVKQGLAHDNFGDLATGMCEMTFRAPCSREECPAGQADFGSGCEAATATSSVCPEGEANFGSGCEAVCPNGQVDAGSGCATPTADVCPEGQANFGAGCVDATDSSDACPIGEAKFGDSETCAAATPTADVCPEGQADFGSGCVAVCPNGQVDAGSGCEAATATSSVCPEGEADFGSGCEAVCPNGQVDAGSGCATPVADACPTDEAKFGDSATCAAATPTADVCPEGQADFGAGCVAATDSAAVCSNDEAKFGDSATCVDATPTADVCPEGQASFGAGCEAVCPNGQVDAGSGCATPAADACPTGACITAFADTFDNAGTCVGSCPDDKLTDLVTVTCVSSCPDETFIDGATCVATCPVGKPANGDTCTCPDARPYADDGTCVAACPGDKLTDLVSNTCVGSCPDGTFTYLISNTCVSSCPEGLVPESGSTCDAPCTYADTTCVAGDLCLGETAVSAECADRSAFNENPCFCTALQQLAALSPTLPARAPWNDLANTAYCQIGSIQVPQSPVECATVGGVQLPTYIRMSGLTGALPPSLGELGSSLTTLYLDSNAFSPGPITSLPTEIGALTALTYLSLQENAITSLPTEVGALAGLTQLDLSDNAISSLPTEVGALTGLVNLFLGGNAITSVPTELAALTGLTWLNLRGNQLTGVPTEFRTWGPSSTCYLYANPGFSCANVGAATSCCTGDQRPGDNKCGEGLSGGPCYTG